MLLRATTDLIQRRQAEPDQMEDVGHDRDVLEGVGGRFVSGDRSHATTSASFDHPRPIADLIDAARQKRTRGCLARCLEYIRHHRAGLRRYLNTSPRCP